MDPNTFETLLLDIEYYLTDERNELLFNKFECLYFDYYSGY